MPRRQDDTVTRARHLARRLLRKQMPERWAHTKGVAHRAAQVAVTVPVTDRDVLVASAWLHDIGYTRALRRTGFHRLDGAIYLSRQGWPDRITALVAHHSGARFVPVERGFADQMADFDFEDSPVSDALTYADQTVGPHGRTMTVEYRIAEAISRHGPDSPNARARVDRVPYLLAVADRVQQRLATAAGTTSDADG
ncbi:HD domain-containing protein [Microlunatus ginsengisoli]|uniref:HDIG domain-containing protein n=1 Tax=Microlunatus ginsengisoli TaxID=363863 RepID=A0ABP7ALN0_9ACTN